MPQKPVPCTICGKVFRMLTHTNERPFKCNTCGSAHRTKGNLKSHIRYVHGVERIPQRHRLQCIMCDKMISNGHMNNHLRKHTNEKPHSCSICKTDFNQSSNLKSHMKSHEILNGDPCVFCGKTFSIIYKPEIHLQSHIKEKPYFCKRCPVSFSHQGNLGVHIRAVHLKERRYSCELCKNTYYSRGGRDKHMSVHLNEKPFQCKICFKRHKSSWGFKCHLDSHNEMLFPCGKCGKTYTSKSNLTRHEKTKHQQNQCIFCEKNITTDFMAHLLKHTNERRFPCNSCEKDFRNPTNLNSHILHIHTTERPYSCQICEKSFKTKTLQQRHIKSHLNEKPFQCTVCLKRFKSSKGLNDHLRSHNDRLKPAFPCSKCIKVYSHKVSLAKHDKAKHQLTQCIFCEKDITTDLMFHLLKHTNERPFSCNSCEKDYQTLNSFNSHNLHLHGTKRPFSCRICGKSFKTKNCQQHHIKSHLNEKPFPCTLCSKRFGSKRSLKYHLKTHTGTLT